MTRTAVPLLIAAPRSVEATIPRILHQVWVGSEPPSWVLDYWDRWATMHPEWEIKHWTNSNSEEWPLTARLRDRITNPTILADLVRIEMVWRHGGVYIDSDMQPLRPIDDLSGIKAWVETINSRVRGTEANNGAFGFPAGHPALVDIWAEALSSLDKKDPQNVAGPRVWRRVLKNHTVSFLFHEAFSGFRWDRRHEVLKFSPDELRKIFPHNYAVHEYDHSWAPSAKTVHPRSS